MMKQGKDHILLHNILLLLSENEYISVLKAASILEVSESTVRRKIDVLDDTLRDSGYGFIKKQPRKGLHLVVENSSAIPQLLSSFGFEGVAAGERQIDNYLFVLLSSQNKRMTFNELSEQVYDSIPVARKKIKECEEWLAVFDLHLKIRKNYGISLYGSEENIRLAMKQLVLNNDLYDIDEGIGMFAKGLDLALLKKCIFAMKGKWNLKFAEESFHSMLVYASLAIVRSRHTKLAIPEADRDVITKYDEYNWSRSLFQLIEEKFSVRINEEEIIFFSLQLLCSYLIHSDEKDENTACKYDEKLRAFVTHIISVVSDVLNVDLTRDSELYYGLLGHIRPAIFRMRFQKQDAKALSNFIKEEYKQMYRVSWALSILFEEYYGINISSTELSYIALYFQASMERLSNPVRMALVTDLGMGLNQLFLNKIRMSMIHVEKISTISLHDFDRSMLKQYDLIVTTSDLNIDSEKIMNVGSLPSDKEIGEMKRRIDFLNSKKSKTKVRFSPHCHNLFDPELIFTGVKVRDKDELLRMLSDKLVSLGYVTDQYHESILKREKTVSTYIGNGVAIPHGNSVFASDSKVVVAILDSPVMWNAEDAVEFVFLLAFKINSKGDSRLIQLFYKGFLEMIETENSLNYLKSLTREEFYQYLIQ